LLQLLLPLSDKVH